MKYVLITMLLFAWNVWVSFFPIGCFFLIIYIEKLAKYRFCYKAWLIHQVSDHIYILENCVSVVSMIGYFPYISILSFKEIEYLP